MKIIKNILVLYMWYIYIYSISFSSITCLDIKSLCLHMAINMHKKVQIIFKFLGSHCVLFLHYRYVCCDLLLKESLVLFKAFLYFKKFQMCIKWNRIVPKPSPLQLLVYFLPAYHFLSFMIFLISHCIQLQLPVFICLLAI